MDTEITLVETEVRLNVLKTVNTQKVFRRPQEGRIGYGLSFGTVLEEPNLNFIGKKREKEKPYYQACQLWILEEIVYKC